jgi:hypothetical protein
MISRGATTVQYVSLESAYMVLAQACFTFHFRLDEPINKKRVASSLPWLPSTGSMIMPRSGMDSPRIQGDVGHLFDVPEAIPLGLCPAMRLAARRHKYTRRKCRG